MSKNVLQLEEVNKLIEDIINIINTEMKSNVYEGLKIQKVLIDKFNREHELETKIQFDYQNKGLILRELFFKCRKNDLLLITSSVSISLESCTFNGSIRILSNKEEDNKSNPTISLSNCNIQGDLNIYGNGHSLDIIGADFHDKNLFIRGFTETLLIYGINNVDNISITESLGNMTRLNSLNAKKLKITQFTNCILNLEILESNIGNLQIMSPNKGDVFINKSDSNFIYTQLFNASLNIQNSTIKEALEITKGSEIRLSNLSELKICEVVNIEHTSFIEIVDIRFNKVIEKSKLIFTNSVLQNCILRRIDLRNVIMKFNNSTSHTLQLFAMKWEDAIALECSLSDLDLYRNFKNFYVNANDSIYSEYFFNLERSENINKTLLDIIKCDAKLAEALILSFNKITGNGFSFIKPISLILFTSIYITWLIDGTQSFSESFSSWLIPFQRISDHNGDIIELFLYLLISTFNTSCLFQAIQGFRKFNKRF